MFVNQIVAFIIFMKSLALLLWTAFLIMAIICFCYEKISLLKLCEGYVLTNNTVDTCKQDQGHLAKDTFSFLNQCVYGGFARIL